MVMRELAEAASNSAAANMSQLPRDLVTASDIVARTVDLLLLSAAGNGINRSIPLKEVNINEVCTQYYCMKSVFKYIFRTAHLL